ncbi:MAG: 4Fe-4S dicluster domain-containing protein [Planctomycetota bacterium]
MSHSRRAFLFKAGGFAAASAAGGFLLSRWKAGAPAHLRRPGAGEEGRFLAACIRCAQCVEACPAQILQAAGVGSAPDFGTPYFVPREQPCDLCQGLPEMQCIAACPTGALAPLGSRRDVRIGVAAIDPETCLPWRGVACKACWHACPFPNDAITFDPRGRAVVVDDACVGCGLCEHVCLTEPSSICVIVDGTRERARDNPADTARL